MGFFSKLWGARRRIEPQRDTQVYARLMNIGGSSQRERPLIKPTPSNLRRFSKTPYARRAINRIKNPIAMLEWEVAPKNNVKLNSALQKQIDVAAACLGSPNQDDSFRTFVEQIVEDILTCGAGAYEQQVGSDLVRPLWMWPVDALSIQVYPGWSGKQTEARYLQTLGYGNVGGVGGIPLRNDELVYIRKDPSTEGPFGWGALEIAFSSINRQLGVASYAGNMASNAQPENMLVFGGMDDATLRTFRNYWRNEIEGQGQTPAWGAPNIKDVSLLKLRGTDDKALFLGFQEFLIREIAVAFEISAISLGIQQDVNRSTAEVAEDMDWDNTIVPMARSVASYINRETVAGRLGFSQIEFRFKGLDRDDEESLAKIYGMEYKANAITPNEYRARRGLPPMDSQWGGLPSADVEIAIKGAQGAKQENPDLLTNE